MEFILKEVRSMADEIKDVDKGVAFILELVLGLFGILGIGYFYAGDNTNGIIRLLVWIFILMFSWTFISIMMAFLIGFCFMPFMVVFQVAVPIWSAFSLKSKLEELYPEN